MNGTNSNSRGGSIYFWNVNVNVGVVGIFHASFGGIAAGEKMGLKAKSGMCYAQNRQSTSDGGNGDKLGTTARQQGLAHTVFSVD